jgi:agmatine/peptidylarginine deiminase
MRAKTLVAGLMGISGLAGTSLGQGAVTAEPASEPVLVDGRLVYPEGAAIPRNMTPAERRFWDLNPPFVPRGTGAPTGPVHCAAEYEPMQAIMLSWNGTSAWLSIVAQMAGRITTVGSAQAWVVVRDLAAENAARTQITAAGADMTKVRFFRRTLDSIWIRDYGPRYIFQGDCRAIVDHVYNRPRPNDDALPGWLGTQLRQPVYEIPLIHGGGNFHLDAVNRGYATRLIVNENPGLGEAEVNARWLAYQNLNMHLFDPYPVSVDSTQHLDMWMQVIGDNKVMISDWPQNPGSTQDVICENAAVFMAQRGYQVYRLPAFRVSNTHYTYTNVVMCNDLVLVPSYTNATVSPSNSVALSTWQAAMPGKTVLQINCQAIVTAAGVMHCIAMHVPAPRGGQNPTAYVVSPDGAERIASGETVTVRWISDDDVATTTADVLMSTDGGTTYAALATAVADTGSYAWTTPAGYEPRTRIKVVVRDAEGRTGQDASDTDIIVGECGADFNGDGVLDFFDYDAFVACFEGEGCPAGSTADANGDGFVDFFDYDAFVAAYEAGC